MVELTKTLQTVLGSSRVKISEPLSLYSSFKTGGNAQWYVEVETLEDLLSVVNSAREAHVPVCVIGSGTNALFADEGYAGLVIKNMCRRFELVSMTGKIRNGKIDVDKAFVYCESGALMNQVVRYVLDQGYGGLEFALGLPGTVGGAVATNADYPMTHTQIGEKIHKAQILTTNGELKEVGQEYFRFGNNTSALLTTGDILLSVFFTLQPGDKVQLWEKGNEAAIYRNQFQEQNVQGQTYRVIRLTDAEEALRGESLPPIESLISHSKLLGARMGNVSFSEKSSRVFINNGGGTTQELLALFEHITSELKNKYTAVVSIQTGKIKV